MHEQKNMKRKNFSYYKRNSKNFENNSYWCYSGRDITTKTCSGIFNNYNFKEIIAIIRNPMIYNHSLRDISRKLYSSNGIVRNTIDYMTALPTLDYVVTNYIKDSSARYNKEVMNYTLDAIKHKEFLRDAILKGCIDGTAFYYFNTAKSKGNTKKSISEWDAENIQEINSLKKNLAEINAGIISLPTDYCRIIGIKNNSYIVSFDLKYFDDGEETAESKLKKYPVEFLNGYNEYKKGTGESNLILDNTKTIVHKISSTKDEPWGRPLVLAAIIDILYSDYFRDTKRNVLDNINNQIIYQTFPEGNITGTSSLTNEQQKKQHEAVRQGVISKNNHGGISFFSVAAGTKIDSIKVDTDLFNNDYESDLDTKIGSDLGFAASLLNASGTTSFSAQQTNLELVTAQIFQWIEQISNELNKVINFNILNKKYINVKVNYLPITHLNRNSNFGFAKDLYTYGRGSLAYLAACAGISKEVFFSMLDEQLEEKIMEKYPVNATSFNTSGDAGEDKGGRPTVEETGGIVTNDSTVKSRTNNTNNQPKPI